MADQLQGGPGQGWASHTSAEYTGDTWGGRGFKSMLTSFLCCWESKPETPWYGHWWLSSLNRKSHCLDLCRNWLWITDYPGSIAFMGSHSKKHLPWDIGLSLQFQMIKTKGQFWSILNKTYIWNIQWFWPNNGTLIYYFTVNISPDTFYLHLSYEQARQYS